MKQQLVGSFLASSLLGNVTNAFTPIPSLSVGNGIGRIRNNQNLTFAHSPLSLSAIRTTVSSTTTTTTTTETELATNVTTRRKNKHGLSPEELRAIEIAVEMRVEAAIEAKVERGAEFSVEHLSEKRVEQEVMNAGLPLDGEVRANMNVEFESVVDSIYYHDHAGGGAVNVNANAVQLNSVGTITAPESSKADIEVLNTSLLDSDARDVGAFEGIEHENNNVVPAEFDDVKVRVQGEERVLKTFTQKATEPMLNSMAEEIVENTEDMIHQKKAVEAKAERILAEIMASTASPLLVEPKSESEASTSIGEVIIGPQNDDDTIINVVPSPPALSIESVGSQAIISDDDEDLSSEKKQQKSQRVVPQQDVVMTVVPNAMGKSSVKIEDSPSALEYDYTVEMSTTTENLYSDNQTKVSIVMNESPIVEKGLSAEEMIPDATIDNNGSTAELEKYTHIEEEALEIISSVSDSVIDSTEENIIKSSDSVDEEEMEEINAAIDYMTELMPSQEIINSEDDTHEVADMMQEKEIIEEMPEIEIVDHSQETLAIEENMSIEEESQEDNAEAHIDFFEDVAVLTHDIKDKISTHTSEQAMLAEDIHDSFQDTNYAEEIEEIPALSFDIQDLISFEEVANKDTRSDEPFEVEDLKEIPAITYDVQDMISSEEEKQQTRAAELKEAAENEELEKLAKQFLSKRTETRRSSIHKTGGGTVDDALAVVEKYAIEGGSLREPILSVDSVIAEIDSVDAAIAKIRRRQAATAKIQKEYLMKRQLEFETEQREREIASEVNQRALLTRRLEFEVEAASQRVAKEVTIKASDEEQEDAINSVKHQAEVALATAQWYESREFKHDQAFRLLVDLGMVAEHLDPESFEYDHAQDDDVVPCDVTL